VIPVLAAFAGRRAVAIVSYFLLALAYVTVLLYALHPTSGDNGEWTNSFVQFQFFSAGTLIALLLRGRLVRLPVPMRVVDILRYSRSSKETGIKKGDYSRVLAVNA
jgi:hypothetical protein